jgi:hypothetical protein
LLRTDGVLAVRGDRATVLPASFRQAIPAYDTPLRKAGVMLVDGPWVDVDPHRAEAVIEPGRLAASHFDEVVARLPPAARPEPTAEPGRYAIAAWQFNSATRVNAAMAVIDAVATVLASLRRPLTDVEDAAALAATFESIPFGPKFFGSPRELIDQLET